MVIYLDTSALLKLYIREEGRELITEMVESADVVATCTVAYAEARSGLARRRREGDFTDQEYRTEVSNLDRDWITFMRVQASNVVAYRAGQLAERHALRGYDAIHLASALRLAEKFGELRFLAFDQRLTNAAQEAGLTVFTG